MCSWENMLKHWGETNWTDDESHTPTPPSMKLVVGTIVDYGWPLYVKGPDICVLV
ncbi:hypothetical protein JHK82_021400 [Glycine max]|nr:hypothetical protein JHK82_021400 [Glycine max]